jgi:hypothetical protein
MPCQESSFIAVQRGEFQNNLNMLLASRSKPFLLAGDSRLVMNTNRRRLHFGRVAV